MKYLAMYLSAPLMSWSTNNRFENKSTDEYPSKSAIYGIICCSLGYSGDQIEFLNELNTSLNISVICYSNINYLNDFQTIGSNYNKNIFFEKMMIPHTNDGKNCGSKILTKTYLINGKYLVILKSENINLLNKIANGLKCPVWPIFFGRKCCIPDSKIFKGIYNSELELFDNLNIKETKKFIISENELNDSISFFKNDVPIQFGENKKYITRKIYKHYYE